MVSLAPLPFRRFAYSSHLGEWEFLLAPPPPDLAGIVEAFWISRGRIAMLFVPDFEPRYLAIVVMCTVFSIVNLPCIATWAALGATLKRWLTHERWRRLFSYAIALLTVYSVVAMWL